MQDQEDAMRRKVSNRPARVSASPPGGQMVELLLLLSKILKFFFFFFFLSTVGTEGGTKGVP